MDEVLFRSSQKIESLQYQLGIAANEGKQFLFNQSENLKDFILQLAQTQRGEQIKEVIKKLWLSLLDLIQEIKKITFIYINPYNFYEQFFKIFGRNWSKRDICFGCAGFLLGGILGYCIGLHSHKKTATFRYMQAIQCSNYLGPESIHVVEDAICPQDCGKNEVLVSVKAASVQIIDAKISEGYGKRLRKILSKHDLPVILGRDCSGIITDIGQNVTKLEIGDEVWLTSPFWAPGTFSQTVCAPENRVAKKPKNVGFESSSSLPYSGGIALQILEKAGLDESHSRDKRVLLSGACSPSGCVLLQILKSWGASITCMCYRRAVPVAKALGAQDIIILEKPLSKDEQNVVIKELELKEPFDVILITKDCEFGAEDLRRFCPQGPILSTNPLLLKSDGFGFFFGFIFESFVRFLCVLKRISGKNLDSFGEPHITSNSLEKLAEFVERGKLQTVVDKVYHPNDIETALNHIQSQESIGSTVITFR